MPWKKRLYVVAGSIFLALGIVGIFLPLVPTTPFLLLTAACYSRGSDKFYQWLMNHRLFGKYLQDWRSNRGIPRRTKGLAIILILITFTISSFLLKPLGLKLAFWAIGLGVIVYISRLPTRPLN